MATSTGIIKDGQASVGGKKLYARILVRRKKNNPRTRAMRYATEKLKHELHTGEIPKEYDGLVLEIANDFLAGVNSELIEQHDWISFCSPPEDDRRVLIKVCIRDEADNFVDLITGGYYDHEKDENRKDGYPHGWMPDIFAEKMKVEGWREIL